MIINFCYNLHFMNIFNVLKSNKPNSKNKSLEDILWWCLTNK